MMPRKYAIDWCIMTGKPVYAYGWKNLRFRFASYSSYNPHGFRFSYLLGFRYYRLRNGAGCYHFQFLGFQVGFRLN